MKLNELLGTEFPLIQGGMANIATGEFAAAVSNAGALGLIGAGGMNADTLRENIRRCKALTDKPFGVNIMLMNPAAPEMAKVVVEEGVKVVTTGAGVPSPYVPAWKEAGIKVFPVVAATALVRRLAPLGVDGFIAEGTESGGHVGELTTMALVPQVKAMTDLPVIAAGGIASGRQLAAAFALLLGLPLERRYVRFTVDAPPRAQAVKFLCGLVLALVIKGGLRAVLGTSLPMQFVRYFVTVLFVVLGYPLLFTRVMKKKTGERT